MLAAAAFDLEATRRFERTFLPRRRQRRESITSMPPSDCQRARRSPAYGRLGFKAPQFTE